MVTNDYLPIILFKALLDPGLFNFKVFGLPYLTLHYI